MKRALAIWLFAATIVHCAGTQFAVCATPPPISTGGSTVTLEEQLAKGLRARRPVEFAYIREIVKLVEQGKLPRNLVGSTFDWARRQRRMELQYFQFALQSRAKKLGVLLPSLDDQTPGIFGLSIQPGVTEQ